MTLLSNSIATPSIAADTATVNECRSAYPPSTPSTSLDGPSPSQVLAMTIRKKRKVLRRKDRDLRVEILLTSTIRRLCQEIGDHLRSRRMASTKRKSPTSTPEYGEDDSWTRTVRDCPKRSRILVEEQCDEAPRREELSMTKKARVIPRHRKALSLPLVVS